jgi:hypothetical protein
MKNPIAVATTGFSNSGGARRPKYEPDIYTAVWVCSADRVLKNISCFHQLVNPALYSRRIISGICQPNDYILTISPIPADNFPCCSIYG